MQVSFDQDMQLSDVDFGKIFRFDSVSQLTGKVVSGKYLGVGDARLLLELPEADNELTWRVDSFDP